MKSTGFIFFIFLLIQKKWKSFIWAILTVFLAVLFSLPWIGLNAWYAYAENFTNFISHPSLSVTAYQTIHSLFNHLTTFNQQWNPAPVVNLSLLGNLGSFLSILAVLTFTSIKFIKIPKSDLAFGAFVAAGLMISPVSLDYHYTMMLLPIILLLKLAMKNQSYIVWGVLALSILLIGSYIPYTSSKVTNGWIAILAYPKLYGAIGLWGMLLLYPFNNDTIVRKEI
jgi:hypothetical protein